jgi:hypothetical protein
VARVGITHAGLDRETLKVALSDLLWACPECAEPGAIAPDGSCRCGAVFSRGKGASIQVRLPDGRVIARSPAEWVDRLPDPAILLERADEGGNEGKKEDALRRARVAAREATGSTIVRSGRRYLNRVEKYGAQELATLEIHPDHLLYRPDRGNARRWPLEALTAVQTSSSTLQIRGRDQPLMSFRFLDDSLFLWELLLHAALRSFYRRTRRGEIVEFQPRIVTRS